MRPEIVYTREEIIELLSSDRGATKRLYAWKNVVRRYPTPPYLSTFQGLRNCEADAEQRGTAIAKAMMQQYTAALVALQLTGE